MKVMTPASSISPGGLLAQHFVGSSWDRWRAVLKAAYAEPMSGAELELFREVAEREPPSAPVQELWCIVGRGGGKDSIASAIATVAALGDNSGFLRAGEQATIFCLATDREQARIAHKYIAAIFAEDENLASLIVRQTSDVIELGNAVEIIIAANNFRSIRGRSAIAAILDEVAFSPDEDSARPIEETYNALLPALARVPGSRLIAISTPYRKAGLLYEKWAECYGKADPDVLVVRGTSRQFNPLLSQKKIDAALKRDPEAAAAEWLAEWRSDLTDYIDRETVEGCVLRGCHELPPVSHANYHAFVDPAGGSGADSMTLAIGHRGEDGRVTIDCVREIKPPFNPSTAINQFCSTLTIYGVSTVVGDRFGGEWCREPFRERGVEYELADKVRSELYLAFLPLLNSGRVEWVDVPRIVSQLCSLERRVARSGRDTIDHGGAGHDDVANVVAGVACLAAAESGATKIPAEALMRARQSTPYSRNRYGRPAQLGGIVGLPYSISYSDMAGR